MVYDETFFWFDSKDEIMEIFILSFSLFSILSDNMEDFFISSSYHQTPLPLIYPLKILIVH